MALGPLMLACLLGAGGAALTEVRVMSFNIRTASEWARTHGGDRANGRTWDQRTKGVVSAIATARAHVVGTQEGLLGQLDDLARALPGWERFGEGREGGEGGGDENEYAAILYNASALERTGGGTFWLSATPTAPGSQSWESSLPRVATWATFSVRADAGGGAGAGAAFGVVNAHFDHHSEEARANSAALVRRFVAARLAGAGPVAVTGDFNAAKDERWYQVFTAPPADLAAGGALAEGLHAFDWPPELPAGAVGGPLLDAWARAESRSCGACGQSTYHAWKGAAAANHMWVEPHDGDASREIALSGTQHVDGVMLAEGGGAAVRVVQAKMITDDKRIRYLGGPHASDHYPIIALLEWDAGGGNARAEL